MTNRIIDARGCNLSHLFNVLPNSIFENSVILGWDNPLRFLPDLKGQYEGMIARPTQEQRLHYETLLADD